MMKVISVLRQAPRPVKWVGLLWLVLGIAGIILGVYSLATFFSLPITGMTEIVIAEAALHMGVAALVVLAAWKFLAGVAWGRTALELASWLSVVYYAAGGLIWIGSALLSWDEFKTSVADQLPGIGPVLKLMAGIVAAIVLVAVSAAVVKALRSPAARRYVAMDPARDQHGK